MAPHILSDIPGLTRGFAPRRLPIRAGKAAMASDPGQEGALLLLELGDRDHSLAEE